MLVDLVNALRFRAWREGRAVRAFTHRRIRIQSHAILAAFLQFPGEDNTILAAALGGRQRRTPKRVVTTADPRMREEEIQLVERLDAYLETYFAWCERHAVAPQLVVASRGALQHLTHIADDRRFARVHPTVAAFANRLTYFTMRAQVPNQQAVVVLTDVLTTHWVTPMDPTQEGHLGAVLATINPPAGADVRALVRAAEATTLGPVTTPLFDGSILQPALARFHTARRRGVSAEMLKPFRAAIEACTRPLVVEAFEALQEGIHRLEDADMEELPQVEAWVAVERSAFIDHRRAEAAGIRTPRQDRPKGGAYRYIEREQAQAVLDAAVECHDTFGRAAGVARGAVVSGVIAAVREVRLPDQRGQVTLVEVVTSQVSLQVRDGHELVDPDNSRVRYTVRSSEHTGAPTASTTTLTLRMVAGMRCVGAPAVGDAVTLVRELPDLERLGRIRSSLKQKLSGEHWALGHAAPLPRCPGRAPGLPDGLPNSPRLALEAIR